VDADLTTWSPRMIGGHHHMGTTRMSDDPRTGVVDRDCRVHGMANLFIAGSSVFPTGGSANPTLTIVALALRMADHLREQVTATG
jgi:choline dehydrogenase-like flavoprotein